MLTCPMHSNCNKQEIGILNSALQSNDIHNKTNMIEFYANNYSSLNVYKSIDDSVRDIKCIGSMMKLYLNNGNYSEMLSLHNNINKTKRDNFCNLLAMEARMNMKNKQFADKIISEHILVNSFSIEVKNALIKMYAEFNGIVNYIAVQQNINTNCLMKAYINTKMHKQTLLLYDDMNNKNMRKDNFSHVCTKLLEYDKCVNIDANIIEQKQYHNNSNNKNALNIFRSIANYNLLYDGLTNDLNSKCSELFKDIITIMTV